MLILSMLWFLATLVALLEANLETTTAVNPGNEKPACECIFYDGFGLQSNGTFKSPNYPVPYDTDILCLLYTFVGSDDEIVELTFEHFELQPRDGHTCRDFVHIFQDLEDPAVNEETEWQHDFCGSEVDPGQKFYSRGRALIFEFHSDTFPGKHRNQHRGFFGEFRFLDKRQFQTDGIPGIGKDCTYTIKSTSERRSGKVFSPQYPYHYPPSAECSYWFKAQPGERVRITIKELDLTPVDGSCIGSDDNVAVYEHNGNTKRQGELNAPKMIGFFCGQQSIAETVISSGPRASLRFKGGKNHFRQGRGFYAEYAFTSELPPKLPERSTSTPIVNKVSPGASKCFDLAWLSAAVFAFPDMPNVIINSSVNMCRPFALAFGSVLHAMLALAILCSLLARAEFGTNEHECDLHVSSDGTTQGGVVFSPLHPNSYPSDTKCKYTFTSKGAERIQIIFQEFNLFLPEADRQNMFANGTYRCKGENDHLSAYVMLDSRMSEIDTFCGSETPPQLMSSKNYLSIDFVAKSVERMRGNTGTYKFKFMYKFVDDFGIRTGQRDPNHVCGFIFYSNQSNNGTLHSPNYPGYYPRKTDCHYEFRGKPKEQIRIYFTYFDVEGYKQCHNDTQSDYVIFSNFQTEDRTNQRFCGTETPIKHRPIQSEANYFRMVFHSNAIFDATGFYAAYQFSEPPRPAIRSVKSGSGVSRNCEPVFATVIVPVLMTVVFCFLGSFDQSKP